MTSKTQQGDQGEATAILHYTRNGAVVAKPLTVCSKYDIVVDDGKLKRVQVKTTNYKVNSTYIVQLRTNGANYTTKMNSTKPSKDEFDILFVVDGEGNAYEIPSEEIDGMSSISLGRNWEKYFVDKYALLT